MQQRYPASVIRVGHAGWLCFYITLLGFPLYCQAERQAEGVRLASFDLLFRHVAQSQRPEAALSAFPPDEARKNLQFTYDIDAATLDILIQQSAAYVAAVAPIDAAAREIIAAAKKKYRVSSPESSQATRVPPPPAELGRLQQAKDDLIRSTLSSMDAAMGPAQLEYMAYRLRGQVTVRDVTAR